MNNSLIIFTFLMAAVPMLAREHSSGQLVQVALYTHFDNALGTTIRTALETELAEIMEPAGVEFEWRSLSSVSGSDVATELVVISFRGECTATGAGGLGPVTGSLGKTHTSDGEVLPFVDVECDKIRAVMRNNFASLPQLLRDRAFGRALGRVVAHELYHVLGHTQRHANLGVAKACYSPAELTAPEFHFEEAEYRFLRDQRPHALALVGQDSPPVGDGGN